MSDINHPKRYWDDNIGYECIDLIKHMPFPLGCVFKYVWRYREKGGAEDITKAIWYLDYCVVNDIQPCNWITPAERAIIHDKMKTTNGSECTFWCAAWTANPHTMHKSLSRILGQLKRDNNHVSD